MPGAVHWHMGRIHGLLFLLVAIALAALANADPAARLRDEIARMDGRLSEAFNAHDVERMRVLFTDDLEFYQDNKGMGLHEQTMRDFGTMFAQNNGITRTLEPDSLEVVALGDYGAVELGRHRFCHLEDGKDECGTFRFVHIWRKLDDGWKISRVISFDH
jgi:ketosteroid isomerase-like protein